MKQILIIGAGSIGNHFANASRLIGMRVHMMDISLESLKRMKNKIYPMRYNKWDKKINLSSFTNYNLQKMTDIDLVVIGTPPQTHFDVYRKILKYVNFKKVLFEKPLCSFTENDKKFTLIKNKKNFFCGYNHSISESFLKFEKKIKKLKNIKLVDIKCNESWNGILKAHFWLKNEYDSYLGNYLEGGGALQEHSHGLHIAICIAKKFDYLKNFKVKHNTIMNTKNKKKYDYSNNIFFQSKKLNINLEINLLADPALKIAKVYHEAGSTEWIVNYKKNCDAIISYKKSGEKKINLFKKSRSGEFSNEIKHIFKINNNKDYYMSNINLENAIDCMKIIKKILI